MYSLALLYKKIEGLRYLQDIADNQINQTNDYRKNLHLFDKKKSLTRRKILLQETWYDPKND